MFQEVYSCCFTMYRSNVIVNWNIILLFAKTLFLYMVKELYKPLLHMLQQNVWWDDLVVFQLFKQLKHFRSTLWNNSDLLDETVSDFCKKEKESDARFVGASAFFMSKKTQYIFFWIMSLYTSHSIFNLTLKRLHNYPDIIFETNYRNNHNFFITSQISS
jgi:hypothetical protein